MLAGPAFLVDDSSCVASGKPLLQVAAEHCFWDLASAELAWLVETLAPEESKGQCEFDLLRVLISKVLSTGTEDEVMKILQKRLKVPDEFEEILAMAALEEDVHEADHEELERERTKLSKHSAAASEF